MKTDGYLRWLKSLNDQKARFFLLVLLATLLFAGALYCLFLHNALRYWDEEHYLLLTLNLHKGIYSFNGITPTAFQPPGYPFFLYVLSLISYKLVLFRFANYLLLAGTIFLLFKMSQKEAGVLAAGIAALMAAAYPLFFYAAGTFYPQILSSALFLLILFLIQNAKNTWQHALSIGVVSGVLILVSPSFMLYLPLLMLYPWLLQFSHKLKPIAFFLLGCVAIVGTWTVRNEITFQRFVLVSSNTGVNLLLGNSAYVTPESGVNANVDKFAAVGEKMNEFEQDAYYQHEAFRWIRSHPLSALKLYFLKSINFFNFKNEFASKTETSSFKDIVSFISYYPLLLLAIGRLCLYKKNPLTLFEKYLLLIFLCSPFLQAIFFTRIRFRIPLDFLMIYFSATGLQLLIDQLAEKTQK